MGAHLDSIPGRGPPSLYHRRIDLLRPSGTMCLWPASALWTPDRNAAAVLPSRRRVPTVTGATVCGLIWRCGILPAVRSDERYHERYDGRCVGRYNGVTLYSCVLCALAGNPICRLTVVRIHSNCYPPGSLNIKVVSRHASNLAGLSSLVFDDRVGGSGLHPDRAGTHANPDQDTGGGGSGCTDEYAGSAPPDRNARSRGSHAYARAPARQHCPL